MLDCFLKGHNSPLSPLTFMEHFDVETLPTAQKKSKLRYMDDIFIIWPYAKGEL